jgi:glycosyltransferase involved in cell wall biosynthesis
MKIAFVSQPLDRVTPPVMNSIGIWTYEIARRLAKSQNVTVYTRVGIASRGEIGENVRTRHIRSMPNRWWSRLDGMIERWSRTNKRPWTNKRPFFSSFLHNLEYCLQIAGDLRRQQADIVHIQNYSQFVPIIRALNPRVKIALHMRCEWLTQLDHAMIARRLNDTDLIFGVSDYITNKIRQTFPEQADKCFTIANGVDMEKFTPLPEPPEYPARTILMVGRISPEKGIHVLLEAFSKVAGRFPDTRLVLVGSMASVGKEYIVEISDDALVNSLGVFYQGDYQQQLNALIPKHLQNRVHFTGGVGYYKTIDFYQHSSILVNPSISEAFGRSLIEGNACGLPVIAARAGGMTEIITPGYNGLLVEPGNANELADAMTALLEDEPYRRQMGINGRRRVFERYTWPEICSELINAYCAPV